MSTIVLNTVPYIGRGLLNGTAKYVSAATTLARYVRTLTGRVNLGQNVSATRWAVDVPIVPGVDDPSCPCPGELPLRSSMIEIVVRSDARAPAVHRDDVLATLQALVLKSEFTDSVTQLAQPGG